MTREPGHVTVALRMLDALAPLLVVPLVPVAVGLLMCATMLALLAMGAAAVAVIWSALDAALALGHLARLLFRLARREEHRLVRRAAELDDGLDPADAP